MHVGIIGGGQLGRMLALAGLPLGLEFTFLDPAGAPCASMLGRHIRAQFDDIAALTQLAEATDVLTFEFENVPAQALSGDSALTLSPNGNALRQAQERSLEKTLFERTGIPVAPWRAVDSQQELDAAVESLGLPLIAKTRSLGYDGKGQRRIRTLEDAKSLYAALGDVPLLLERLVEFDAELSVIGSRGRDGSLVVYPLTRNQHRDGILVRSETADFSRELRRQAVRHLRAIVEELDYVGTIAIEFFVCGELLLGNEFAPRVHNSGHWTIDGASHCQFENHLRAICGMPLGTTELERPAGMLNLIGEVPGIDPILKQPDTFLHDYGKRARPGRKVGHINVVAETRQRLGERLDTLAAMLGYA